MLLLLLALCIFCLRKRGKTRQTPKVSVPGVTESGSADAADAKPVEVDESWVDVMELR